MHPKPTAIVPGRGPRRRGLKWLTWLLFAWLMGLPGAESWCAPAADLPWGQPGSFRVTELEFTWLDEGRQRQVPAKLYVPVEGRGPFPVVLVSHGLGGTKEGYAYLGRHLAGHGYVSVHLQHKGSDREEFLKPEGSLRDKARSAKNLVNALNRPLDLRFALKQLERLNREDPVLKGRLALERVGAVGHSFGAFTVLAAAGLGLPQPLARHLTLSDPRIRAVIAMSAPVRPQRDHLSYIYGSIKVPCLHMTGTRDDSPLHGTKAADRRLPYDHMHLNDQYLITFEDGDHFIFSGRPRAWPGGEKDARFQALIRLAATAFLDAYLKEDAQARAWLRDGGLARALAGEAQVEMKFPPPSAAPAREKND